MIKRATDIIFSSLGLIVFSPILLVAIILVWLQDFKSPFYIAPRVGINRRIFKMIKIRTMVVNADKSGVDTTSANDMRITPIGRMVRKIKLDELIQLWNVLKGDMSLVGPRPQVERDVDIYTDEEYQLLNVRPGVTDFSSIIFSDEGEIVSGSENPDLCYNQLIRPWKSRLGLFYIQKKSFLVDLIIILITILSIFSKRKACLVVSWVIKKLGSPENIVSTVRREKELLPTPPPGAINIVTER